MNEPSDLLITMTTIGGILIMVGGIAAMLGFSGGYRKTTLTGFLVMILGMLGSTIVLYPSWGARWLSLQNLATSVPTLAWIVAGITIYFNLNLVYASWLIYAHQHPGSWAEKIIGPKPIGLPPKSETVSDRCALRIFGIPMLFICWLVTLMWLIFGGGIAKLLRLVPRE